jgi:NADH-quinone oxidoreductase subunit A
MTPLAAYLLLFLAVGVGFIFVHLVAGKLIRPSKPSVEKGTVYECGEPTIGSAWVQFDLRFYVVALLFVIFDVEVAFFFPWAEVFGKANAIATAERPPETPEGYRAYADKVLDLAVPARSSFQQGREIGRYQRLSPTKEPLRDDEFESNQRSARQLALLALIEILVFFGVLLVGFAYLWRRGDLAWVRSTAAERPQSAATTNGNGAEAARELAGAGTGS